MGIVESEIELSAAMPDERNIHAFMEPVISVSLLTYANAIKGYLLSASRRVAACLRRVFPGIFQVSVPDLASA